MKLPRDVSGTDLVKALRSLGYEVDRQRGSHIRIRVHNSTMTKAYWFQKIPRRLLEGSRLHTNHSNFRERVDIVLENPVAKILGFVSVIFTIVTTIIFFTRK
jgi:hypothetical protein